MPRPIAPVLALALVLVALGGSPVAASETARRGDDNVNVQVTLTVIDVTDGGVRTGHSVRALAVDGHRARTTTGWRLPIPKGSSGGSSRTPADVLPVTLFSYQEVGLSAAVEARVVGAGRVRVSGIVDLSAVDEEASTSELAPSFGAFEHDFDLILQDGVPTPVAEVAKPQGGSMSLSISASIQD